MRIYKKASPRVRAIIALTLLAGMFYIVGTLDQTMRIFVLLALVCIIGGLYR